MPELPFPDSAFAWKLRERREGVGLAGKFQDTGSLADEEQKRRDGVARTNERSERWLVTR
jgi:hypothetical protein